VFAGNSKQILLIDFCCSILRVFGVVEHGDGVWLVRKEHYICDDSSEIWKLGLPVS
jgi:hypothetical protein